MLKRLKPEICAFFYERAGKSRIFCWFWHWWRIKIVKSSQYKPTVVEIGISKPNGCQVLGPLFLESATPGVFKNDIREIADFHPSETLDQKQFLKVILLSKVKIFNYKSKILLNKFWSQGPIIIINFQFWRNRSNFNFSEIIPWTPIIKRFQVAWI